jgi:hypothetical protein
MGGIDLKDQLLQQYLLEVKGSSRWYMKLFSRLLNNTILNHKNTGRRTEQLSYRVQLVEGLFVKCGNVTEHKIPGRYTIENTVL